MSNTPLTPPESDPRGRSGPEVERVVDEVRVRRAPKYPVFIFGGIIIGVVVTFIAVSVAPGRNDTQTPFLQAFGYFVLYGIAIGAVVGSVVAIVIDSISARRARSVATERVTIDPEPSAEGEFTPDVSAESSDPAATGALDASADASAIDDASASDAAPETARDAARDREA